MATSYFVYTGWLGNHHSKNDLFVIFVVTSYTGNILTLKLFSNIKQRPWTRVPGATF